MQKNPVVFWELASHDMKKSADFFRKVFDWKIEFSERLGFFVIPQTTPPEESIEGGIFTLKKAKLPFMTVYLQVDDILEKANKIEEQGGYIIEGPHEIPNGSMICLFNEPSGVTFAMIQPRSAGKDHE